MGDYLTFRSNALAGLAMLRSNKNKANHPPNHWSRDDVENWIKKEYERHYPKAETPH